MKRFFCLPLLAIAPAAQAHEAGGIAHSHFETIGALGLVLAVLAFAILRSNR